MYLSFSELFFSGNFLQAEANLVVFSLLLLLLINRLKNKNLDRLADVFETMYVKASFKKSSLWLIQ